MESILQAHSQIIQEPLQMELIHERGNSQSDMLSQLLVEIYEEIALGEK